MTTAALPSNVEQWIARLRLIDMNDRSFMVDTQRAQIEFGVDAELAQQLVAHGMPYDDSSGDLLLDETDLHYLGLRAGWSIVYCQAMRQWARTLERWADRALEIEVQCVPHAAPGTAVDVVVAPGRRARMSSGPDRVATTFTATTGGDWPAVDPGLHELLSELAEMDFCRLPPSLHDDVDFAWRTRLADCTLASRMLVDECNRRGVPARTSYGLLVVPPFSTPHSWAELYATDRWVPVDPLLLRTLAIYSGLNGEQWPPWRSPGALLLRLESVETALVLHDGEPVRATYPTTVSDATA